MSTQEFRVLGMSCELVTVVSADVLEPAAVRAAVEAAGYELVQPYTHR